MKKLILIILTLFSGPLLFAQSVTPDATPASSGSMNSDTLLITAIWIVIAVSILVLIVAIYALVVLKTVLLEDKAKTSTDRATEASSLKKWFNKITSDMTDAVPVEQEETVMLDHNYDGIRELDNHLPPWWKWLFIISIIWGAIYLLAFHVFHWFPLSGEEYERQMEKAKMELTLRKASKAASVDETTVEFTNDPAVIDAGKEIFAKNCIPCHAVDGGGGVGPNLTDQYWIHGGSIHDIFRTIKYGVPDKGMITWQTQLSPVEIRDVACFVYTLEGTKPAKPKEPQGELYVRKKDIPVKSDSLSKAPVVQSKDSINLN